MKKVIFLAVLIFGAIQAQADLSVVTMPLTGTNPHLSKFADAKIVKDGVLVNSDDGRNECLVGTQLVPRQFIEHLRELNSSSRQYLLSCYSQGGSIIQIQITEAR